MPRAAIFGELLIDHKTIQGKSLSQAPGGPPIFIAQTLQHVAVTPIILAHYGSDYPKSWMPKDTAILPLLPTVSKNPRYFLDYQGDTRRLHINDASWFQPVLHSDISTSDHNKIQNAQLVYFASTLPLYPPEVVRKWITLIRPRKVILIAQGVLRDVSPDGNVRKRNPEDVYTWLDAMSSHIDLIVYSEQDHEVSVVEEIKHRYSRRSIVAVTQGIQGAHIAYKDQEISVPTKWPVYDVEEKPIDATGAGDRWAAAFSYHVFIEKQTVGKSAEKAHHIVASYLKQS